MRPCPAIIVACLAAACGDPAPRGGAGASDGGPQESADAGAPDGGSGSDRPASGFVHGAAFTVGGGKAKAVVAEGTGDPQLRIVLCNVTQACDKACDDLAVDFRTPGRTPMRYELSTAHPVGFWDNREATPVGRVCATGSVEITRVASDHVAGALEVVCTDASWGVRGTFDVAMCP